jgi:predicted acetyltransferase
VSTVSTGTTTGTTTGTAAGHRAADGVVLRPIDLDSAEVHAWMRAVSRGLKDPGGVPQERVELRRPVYRTQRVSAAFDGDDVVGTFRSWDLDLTVPGGAAVRADAISSVSVQPTHRRRGILTRMMTGDLAAAADRGVGVAILIASEGGIYGRFGFGPSTETSTWTLDLRTARFPDGVGGDADGRCRIVEADQLRPLGPQVYRRSRTAGAINRTDQWWDLATGVVPWPGEDPKHRYAVMHHDPDGVPDGLLLYRVEESWLDRVPANTVHVNELVTATPQAYRGLWRYLAELDLVTMVRAEERPIDEALPWLLIDQRAARQATRCDFEWTRLLDPAAALSARRYETPGEVTFEVVDEQGWAAGRYRLEVDAGGSGRCTRTSAPAQITLTVQALSALWLGGGGLGGAGLDAAVLAGQAVEHRDGGTRLLGAILRTARAPWTSTWF